MYNQSYDEYIRSILGYNANNQFMPMQNTMDYNFAELNYGNNPNNKAELEACYPEIYKIVYPMVKKTCENASTNLTKNDIDKMTEDIYIAIEGKDDEQNRDLKQTKQENNRSARPINRGLRDIIRILLLRELLGRPNIRPPFPPQRPPFSPGGPGGRPPFRPRFDSDLYEY